MQVGLLQLMQEALRTHSICNMTPKERNKRQRSSILRASIVAIAFVLSRHRFIVSRNRSSISFACLWAHRKAPTTIFISTVVSFLFCHIFGSAASHLKALHN